MPKGIKAAKRRLVFERDGWGCLACGSFSRQTIDHIRPKSQGGDNSMDNLQTLCFWCNCAKDDTHVDFRTMSPEAKKAWVLANVSPLLSEQRDRTKRRASNGVSSSKTYQWQYDYKRDVWCKVRIR